MRPYAVLNLYLVYPDEEPQGRVYSIKRVLPVERVLQNSTENYNAITRELGDMIWHLRNELGRNDDHPG